MVVGFAFDTDGKKILLIEKIKPDWQRGFINGVGGKIEGHESPYKAMVREFQEETGQLVESFVNYAVINGSGWRVYFFRATIDPLCIHMNPTEEKLLIASVKDLPSNVLYNLNWLIPLALDDDMLKPAIIYDRTRYVRAKDGSKKETVWED